MRNFNFILLSVTFILITILMHSCIAEDNDSCPKDDKVKIYFSYLDIDENRPKGIKAKEVDRIRLFIFDENNKFYEEWTDNAPTFNKGYHITLPLQAGKYRFIAWGGNADEDFTFIPQEFIKGKTDLNEAFLKLNRDQNNTINKINHNLFFAELNEAKVVQGNEVFVMPMKQHTNLINVIINNWEDNNRFELTISDSNGIETFDNQLATDNNLFYNQPFASKGENQTSASIRIMRLINGRHPQLVIYDTLLKKEVLRDDLIDLLLEMQRLGTPVDFDNIHEYTLTITLGLLYYTIDINGWIVERENLIIQ